MRTAPLLLMAASASAALTAEAGGALTVLGGALARTQARGSARGWEQVRGAWVRLPPARPWACLHFVGGAALGAYPQICYDRLLTSVCDRAGVAVISTPYDVGPDHARLSSRVFAEYADARDALLEAEGLPPSVGERTYRLGHSLGAKLLAIGASAENSPSAEPLGVLAYNNFALKDSVSLATSVAQQLGGNTDPAISSLVDGALKFATQLGEAQGLPIEFTPSPAELAMAINANFAPKEIAIWRFEPDTLDSSDALLEVILFLCCGCRCSLL